MTKTHRKNRSFHFFFAFILTPALCLTALFLSCKNELLEAPDFNDRGAYVNASISAPSGVSATQGGFRSITISWKAVANAVKYEVYSSRTPTGTFEKTTETNGNEKVSVTLRADSDTLTYYKVKAYNKNGGSSEFSRICYGSTLAAPVITNIVQDESGKSATVKWFGGQNCTERTYKNEVMYSVILYMDSEGSNIIDQKDIDNAATEWKFTGLTPKTLYYYQVKAYLKSAPGKEETSGILDKETARRLIPNPVEELSATQGTSPKEVGISFILPSLVDVSEGGGIFVQTPLYFEISRAEVEYTKTTEIDKETGSAIYKEGVLLSDYSVIATIKSGDLSSATTQVKGSRNASAKSATYFFDCRTEKTSEGSPLSLSKTPSVDEDGILSYTEGYRLTYTDTTMSRSTSRTPVYSYKITSYADTEKKITSDESVARTLGWLVGIPRLDIGNPIYDYNEQKTEINKITVDFSGSIEDYGIKYTYIVTQGGTRLDGQSIDETVIKHGSASELKAFSHTYNLSNDTEGYYSYHFYVCPADTSGETPPSEGNYYDVYNHQRKITVIKDVNSLPKIERFEVSDGYSDKFIIEWDYNENYSYSLNWTPVVNGKDQEQQSIDIEADSLKIKTETVDGKELKTATFDHEAHSGDVRKYSITVTSVYDVETSDTETRYTLGTAAVSQDGYAYDTITIKWNPVEKATGYVVEAYYADDKDRKTPIQLPDNEISATDTTLNYVWKPTETTYADAKVAGKEIQFLVKAKSDKYEEDDSEEHASSTTTAEISTRLIGPAMLGTLVNINSSSNQEKIESNYITLSWSKVPGAKGYLINRVQYTDTSAEKLEDGTSITYYYDISNESNPEVTLHGSDASPGRGKNNKELEVERVEVRSVKPSSNEYKYELYDIYAEPDTEPAPEVAVYQRAQARLPWGIPFGYVVIPVLNKEDFELDGFTVSGKFTYTNITPTIGATIGYGMRVDAEKAEHAERQKIGWNPPYYNRKNSKTDKFVPVLYKRKYGQTNNEWTRVRGYDNTTSEIYTIPSSALEKYSAVEYAVKYVSTSGKATETLPPSYMDYLADTMEDDSRYNYGERNKEPLNKGYLFTTGFTAEYGANIGESGFIKDDAYFSELVMVDDWDFTEKALGPTGYTLEIFNPNLSKDWNKVIDLELDNGELTKKYTKTEQGTIITVNGNAIRLSPNGLKTTSMTGNADGFLKVLRSAKHYYRLTMTREIGSDSPISVSIGDDKSVYAYRQITDEELVRAATLAMAYGVQQTNISWITTLGSTYNYSELFPGGGETIINSKGGTTIFVKLTHGFTFENFTPVLPTKSEEKVTFLTVHGTMEGVTNDGGSSGQHYAPRTYTKGVFSIEPSEDYGGLYKATMTISDLSVNSSSGITIEYESGTRTFGNITPFVFGNGNNKFAANPLNDGDEKWQ